MVEAVGIGITRRLETSKRADVRAKRDSLRAQPQ